MADCSKPLAGLLLCLLAGCAASPERSPQTTAPKPPARWAADAPASIPALENWADSFADPALGKLVREAVAHNFDLKAAAARIDAARAQARIEGAGRWPQLGFGAGYQRSQVRDSGYGSAEYGAFEAIFDLNWELDVWGRILAGQRAAEQEAEAAAADFRAARLSLAARVAQTWFELAEARLQVAVAEQSIRDRRTLVDLVRGRFSRGLTRGLDLRLALTDLANAEAQLAEARNREQGAGRRLEVLLGRYPANAVGTSAGLPPPPDGLAAGLPSALLARRPDLAAAFRRLAAADARLENAEKALLPRIALTANGGTRNAALAEMADPRSAVWNLAMGLAQPLFTGGRLKGGIQAQEAHVEEALRLYQGAALNAFREVERALAAEESLRAQEAALREAVAQTEASRKLAVYSYRQGLIEILTLLDSYRSTLNAQSAHLQAQRLLLNNRIELYLALGIEAFAAD
jgi:NodT family efflux transporter outer membrane factor (OMF) lipoprotein